MDDFYTKLNKIGMTTPLSRDQSIHIPTEEESRAELDERLDKVMQDYLHNLNMAMDKVKSYIKREHIITEEGEGYIKITVPPLIVAGTVVKYVCSIGSFRLKFILSNINIHYLMFIIVCYYRIKLNIHLSPKWIVRVEKDKDDLMVPYHIFNPTTREYLINNKEKDLEDLLVCCNNVFGLENCLDYPENDLAIDVLKHWDENQASITDKLPEIIFGKNYSSAIADYVRDLDADALDDDDGMLLPDYVIIEDASRIIDEFFSTTD